LVAQGSAVEGPFEGVKLDAGGEFETGIVGGLEGEGDRVRGRGRRGEGRQGQREIEGEGKTHAGGEFETGIVGGLWRERGDGVRGRH